ncbi:MULTISPECIES: ABC transporter ATP-binding protein [Micrococcaceae]|uniref:ABC transporter ATP-binding protein n=1 Tax=Glutamicibacter soli TaxID=453836 RepID=A0A365YGK2_9MICC|nr:MULTISPECIES: ABC transporter ATP-binding protein [Micrococcaceae]RBM01738.1 ABC transporter ATP-binding protein [Glutamicibacter soli]RKS18132.1 ABC-2 type transport system ATP-binding protein [Arthrobacter sp. AG1021]
METLNRTEAVSLTGLRKTFTTPRTKVEAVRGVDLSIQAGQIVALLGPNGAGKTTTVDMILGLTQPSSGSVEVLGLSPHRAVTSGRVSAVLQTGGLLRDMTVRETITVIATMHGQAGRVTQVMDRTGLTAIAKRRVGKCSGGEQQRIKFALALLPDPDVLILDEPTAGMDVMARRDFWENMRSEASSGRTIIFATHYLEEAQNFAERTVLMSHGRIVADGATEELRKLISGRTVSATLPTEQAISQAEAFDASVSIAERNGQRISFKCADSDRFAQTLLTDLGAWDLEISAPSLEDAFIQLTEDAQ